ncbi:unnamed protein product [Prorocentrum cordatum]|uniref:YEATS domain-containing protein n=1 Tax=Prorocentrum cordatum TaxID=2364126 RepID=A0ABN9STS6_9DINO|nr:unnamed protein product [Polarella glacialis]
MAKHIIFGNTAQLNRLGTWDWTFYVRPADFVEEVVVTLHPTFANPVRNLQGPKLELQCSGWGTFELKVDICWRGGGRLQTTWKLMFDPDQSDFNNEIEVPAEAAESARPALLAQLAAAPAVDPGGDPRGRAWHGRLVRQELPRPRATWESRRRPREDNTARLTCLSG